MSRPHKYWLYEEAVQSPKEDVALFAKTFRHITGRPARTFREDFCGTFRLSTEWVKRHPQNSAIGLDLDTVPLQYGKQHHLSALRPDQRKRVRPLNKNVLTITKPPSDLIAACNFSYCVFKSRPELLNYLSHCHQSLTRDGMIILDITGGSDTYMPNTEQTVITPDEGKRFTYIWDQISYDPITNEAKFYIHFTFHNGRKVRKVFVYDWRMWTIPELREVMHDAGFKRTYVYWEGDDGEGGGSGHFSRTNHEENCDVWVAYVVGSKK